MTWLLASALPASAADDAGTAVENVSLSWSVNDESGGGSFFGGCNFLSAGTAGNTGSSRLWTEADGFYKPSDDNVTITKPDASGNQSTPTWASKCQDASGAAVSTSATSSTKNQVNISNGTGTIDMATNSADIKWAGSFTIVYYGGLTYWTISNPELTITNGHGALTGTFSGYGASMEDPTKWVTLDSTEGTLANFQNSTVTVNADGTFKGTPDYAGVTVDTGSGTAQSTTGSSWGSFPQSWVDFNTKTGQASYWFSSGGTTDPRRKAAPINFTVGSTADDGTGGDSGDHSDGNSGDDSGGSADTDDDSTGSGASTDVAGTIAGANFRWGLNQEVNSGAFYGGCNFLSAGVAGDAKSSRLWKASDGLYSG